MDEHTNTGVIAEAAVQSDTVQEQSVQQHEEQQVPLSALQAERRERQQLQENMKLMQDHMALLQANNQNKAKDKESEFNGLTDNDVLTVGEAKKFMQDFSRKQELAVEELRMSQANHDYDEVVRKYLPEVLKTDPDLKDVIMNAPNPYKIAYHLAKRSDSYLKDQSNSSRSPEAKQAVQNLNRPGNLSSVGSTSASSQASQYKNMSDKDFKALVNKNRGFF